MSSCQSFKQKIEEFKKKTEELRRDLEQYKDGEKEYLKIFEEDYGKLEKEIEEFKNNEYTEEAKNIIKNWYVKETGTVSWQDEFFQQLHFNDNGDIVFAGDMDFLDSKSVISYFPQIIKEINGDLYLRSLTSAKGLTFPQSIGIGGDIYFNSLTSAEGLILPQSVSGSIFLMRLAIIKKEKLRKQYPNLRIW